MRRDLCRLRIRHRRVELRSAGTVSKLATIMLVAAQRKAREEEEGSGMVISMESVQNRRRSPCPSSALPARLRGDRTRLASEPPPLGYYSAVPWQLRRSSPFAGLCGRNIHYRSIATDFC